MLRRRQDANRRKEDAYDAFAWMFTFSDLILLLLTMFVLRLSMSPVDLRLFQERIAEFSGRKIQVPTEDHVRESSMASATANRDTAAENLTQHARTELSDVLGEPVAVYPNEKAFQFKGEIAVLPKTNGFLVVLGGASFASGGIQPSFLAQEAVLALGKVVAGRRVSIEISGHTDSEASESNEYASNWELSQARAMTIARQMIDAGVSAQYISIAGYADTKPVIRAEAATDKPQNKRVEILVKLCAKSD